MARRGAVGAFRAHQTPLWRPDCGGGSSPQSMSSSRITQRPPPAVTEMTCRGDGRCRDVCPELRLHGATGLLAARLQSSGRPTADRSHSSNSDAQPRGQPLLSVRSGAASSSLGCPGHHCCRLAVTARTTPTTWRRPRALQTRMYRHLAVTFVTAHVAAPVEFALAQFYACLVARSEASLTAEQVAAVNGVRTLQTEASPQSVHTSPGTETTRQSVHQSRN